MSYFEEEQIGGGDIDDDSSVSSSNSSSSSDSEQEGGGAFDDDVDVELDLIGGAGSDDEKGEDDDEDAEDEENIGEEGLEGEEGGEGNPVKSSKEKEKVRKIPSKTVIKKAFADESSDEDDDGDGEQYLKKFDKEINDNYLLNFHPECALQNYDEILAMTTIVRDENNIIIDNLHRTNPFLTKYERARILGQRAKQIETGATPFVKVPENMIDGYLIAELELQQGRIPFIIRRPLPNGGSEFWKINDLENISF
jgi:DNA-directed RNA polymerase I, II, and III subunit RPABC2